MANETAAALMNFAPIALMLLIFYFLLYRPQKKAQKERQEMLDGLKVGVRVVTIGGIFGTITALTDEIVHLKIAANVEIEVSRQAISSVAVNKESAE